MKIICHPGRSLPRTTIRGAGIHFFPGAVHSPLADMKKVLPLEVRGRMMLIHYADNYGEQDISSFYGWSEQGVRYIF